MLLDLYASAIMCLHHNHVSIICIAALGHDLAGGDAVSVCSREWRLHVLIAPSTGKSIPA